MGKTLVSGEDFPSHPVSSHVSSEEKLDKSAKIAFEDFDLCVTALCLAGNKEREPWAFGTSVLSGPLLALLKSKLQWKED